ncbi:MULTISPECIES: trans-aconitate 2-methyltransferase [unclassified Micromonospora]|uniref:class I SAM-dependent methyltransferase n=1 Tax=unclassified Micromonospora TaxID=2617518 RepID=UPI001034A1CD|nr:MULTISPECIES: class I SAM-dependent methyltransferase [unclassified Micromonospora]QKW14632.1 class I SAM-dependent methyltransferase [Verrucosispora sp. NA02020]TBL29150.1 class I SAM-dependent methyltransferase [Verrucosispora sp. SN26_14.1]
MTDRTRTDTGHVDAHVDEAYLDACADAWQVTGDLAQSILDTLDPEAVDAGDEHRGHCVAWLRRAAERRTLPRPVPSVDPTAGSHAPTVDLLRHAAGAYPGFLDGTSSGRKILLAGPGMRLWHGYFQSDNLLYRPLNAAAAAAVETTLRTGGGTRILEVGAGTGGATAHLLAHWPDDLRGTYDYTVTDMSASLLVGARRRHSGNTPAPVRLEFRRFDFDLADDQGLAPDGYDVVLAVNALHIAADIPSTLRHLRSLVRPGGALVLSESLCAPGDLVHQEFIFNLLPLSAEACRRGSRFHSAAAWQTSFDAAGVDAEIQVNSAGPELVMVAVATAPDAP